MSDIGTPITSGAIPAVGTSGTTYASNLNLFLTEVKNRLEAKVPRTSLDAGNLDLDGYYLQNAGYVGLSTQVASPTTPTGTLQSYNGELYWVGTGGVVQITSSGTLNAGSIGGITGDYGGANPAQFRFVDADQEYYAYDTYSGAAWARIWAKNFDIAAGSTSTFRVRLAFGGGASYTMTLPAAVPSETTQLRMDSSGNVTVGRQTKTLVINGTAGQNEDTIGTGWALYAGYIRSSATTSSGVVLFPISLDVGDIITGYTVYGRKTSAGTVAFTSQLAEIDGTTGSATANVTPGTGTETTTANNPGYITLSKSGLTYTVSSGGKSYYILAYNNNTGGGEYIYTINVTYTSAL